MKGIYGIYRKSDDACLYVGQSGCIENRIKNHFSFKFNHDEHYYKVLEENNNFSRNDLFKKENHWISELKPLLNKNQLEYGDNAKCIFLEGNELYMITRGDEHHYFTSLYRAGLFIGKQRAPVEYALLKERDVNGWNVEIVDGSKVMWENIDEKKTKIRRTDYA